MTAWGTKRKTPYTDRGILRLKCIRCGARASAQWQICAEGGNYRTLCDACDVELNEMVLRWVGHPNAKELIDKYSFEKNSTSIPEPSKDHEADN